MFRRLGFTMRTETAILDAFKLSFTGHDICIMPVAFSVHLHRDDFESFRWVFMQTCISEVIAMKSPSHHDVVCVLMTSKEWALGPPSRLRDRCDRATTDPLGIPCRGAVGLTRPSYRPTAPGPSCALTPTACVAYAYDLSVPVDPIPAVAAQRYLDPTALTLHATSPRDDVVSKMSTRSTRRNQTDASSQAGGVAPTTSPSGDEPVSVATPSSEPPVGLTTLVQGQVDILALLRETSEQQRRITALLEAALLPRRINLNPLGTGGQPPAVR
ncbi:uncharacterized protein MEPE_00797 [Melanopsichium pennsylvanicum]|uniref:Uncharacterized protein n=1 Tax=Melanopsichium pennsylvanicum TaxID=63383 RepID=A0AAJ4XI05_9BASI|nr:uncharacterized protein MEPE_00797 [Melanopsichium pennsylvanicum]